MDNPESERDTVMENNMLQAQPLRGQSGNIYEYRDSPSKYSKMPPDGGGGSIRSPSSLGMTQVTGKSGLTGSQSSLRSAISMKESSSISPPPLSKESNFDRNIKYAGSDTVPSDTIQRNGKFARSDSKNLLANQMSQAELARSQRDLGGATSPMSETSTMAGSVLGRSQQITPVPSSRGGGMKSNNASRTNLIEGIPQTAV